MSELNSRCRAIDTIVREAPPYLFLRSGMLFATRQASNELPHTSFLEVRVSSGRISRGGWLAVSLGVIGSLIAIGNVIVIYRRSGDIAWGKVALAIGVPVLIYAMVSARRNGSS